MRKELTLLTFDRLDDVCGGQAPSLSQPAGRDSTAADLGHFAKDLGNKLVNPVGGISSGIRTAWNNTTKSRQAGEGYGTQVANAFSGFFGFER